MAKREGDTVYRVTEVIGTSSTSWEDAVRNAVKTAAGTLRDLRIAEIEKLDVKIEDGRLALAVVCRKSGHALIGYAATSEWHTYFRWREGVLELVAPDTPDASLEELAFGFVGEWLWYDEEGAPVERARYADYGYPVRGANLKSEKLALLRPSGLKFSSLDAAGREVREALIAQWLNPA